MVLMCVVVWRSHMVDIAKHVMSDAKVYGMREKKIEDRCWRGLQLCHSPPLKWHDSDCLFTSH